MVSCPLQPGRGWPGVPAAELGTTGQGAVWGLRSWLSSACPCPASPQTPGKPTHHQRLCLPCLNARPQDFPLLRGGREGRGRGRRVPQGREVTQRRAGHDSCCDALSSLLIGAGEASGGHCDGRHNSLRRRNRGEVSMENQLHCFAPAASGGPVTTLQSKERHPDPFK